MVTCNACGGRYEPVQADGTQYFHACPPLSVHELRDGVDAGTVVLSDVDQKRLASARKLDATNPPDNNHATAEAIFFASLTVPRPGARDENLVSTREKDKGAMKAAGAGVAPV
jgi:hypothetical protein